MAMSGSRSSGRRRHAMSEINVTPLVDVMLVLLIIFMVTAPMMNQGLNIDLPKTKPSGLATQDESIRIKIQKNGIFSLDSIRLPQQGLMEKVKAITAARPDTMVLIEADQGAEYGLVASVIADLKSFGVNRIGLVTEPKQP